ncbi:Gluconolactonase [Phytophthora citrophthora]|uniref:Gluconolactonase n=1 Tax=Phytophthora citrophthora TaxID=4793 RepID=A0AAD9G3U6_9STRA|nr:Gluconolactonase [Phytophthora citrophthora]
MRCMRWLLLAALALAAVQAAPAKEQALMELEETLLASTQVQNGRRLLSVDLFEEHAARYLMVAADTTEEVAALFKLYKKLYPKEVAAWGSTEARQLAYFEANVFPSIEEKAKKLLSSNSGTGTSGTNVGDESGTGTGTSGGTSTGGTTGTSGTSGTSTSGGTTTSGTSTSGGTTSSGTSTSGGTTSSGTSTSGGTTTSSGTTSGGTTSSGTTGGTSGTTSSGTTSGGTTSGGTSGTTSTGTISGGTTSSGTTSSGTTSTGTTSGGTTSSGTTSGGTTSTGTTSGGTTSSGTTSSGTTSGGTSTSSGTLTAASTSSKTSSASGSSFWSTTYNSQLSSNVNSLKSQTNSVETVVQSSSASSTSSSSAAAAYTSPTVLSGLTSPSRRFLSSGSSDSSNIDVLFCDIEGNAIWKWSAEDVPDATVTNTSSSTTEIDVDVDGVCSATTTLTVSAYQTGCSLQNHPEGCDNVYYKGCGGITVSPTSDRIVIARTGGRTLGVLNYKSVDSACQGQVVDAISTYRGKKFNSPTYAEYANNGILYFTDSPFGLATSDADFDGDTLDNSPLREIPFNGVYMLHNGSSESVELVDCDMTRPNKIAFSPAQDIMYITNSQKGNSYIKSYVMADDGTASNSSVFFNFTAHPELETDDGYAKGIKVDDNGYVYVVCYKGVYIFSPEAELAGAIMSSEELDSVSMGLGRLFISGSFGLVAQTSGVPSQTIPQAQVTCSA